MDAVNMNKMARDMRPELLGTKAQKIRFWIDDVDVKVKRRLDERIKIIPTVIMRSQTPERDSMSATKALCDQLQLQHHQGNAATKSAKDVVSHVPSEEDVTMIEEKRPRSIH